MTRTRPAFRPLAQRIDREATTLTPLSAHGFDALDTSGDPRDENGNLAGYAIDQSLTTSWRSQYYLGNPVFGGLKAGSGLIVDMGRAVRLTSARAESRACSGLARYPGESGAIISPAARGDDLAVRIE